MRPREILTPLDFVATARSSVEASGQTPTETDCRRAVSTAYYAVFHCLAADCANLLIGPDGSDRGREAWRRVYRALEHGPARDRCGNRDRMRSFPPEIRNFAGVFARLQDRRHEADYDPFIKPTQAEAQGFIGEAAEAIDALRSAPEPDRRAFCAYVLFRDRR
jgi:uncharacterized protein (UPF0332 family)